MKKHFSQINIDAVFNYIYARLPIFLQEAVLFWRAQLLKRRRYNKEFYAILRAIESDRFSSREEIRNFQLKKLKQVVENAYYNVPFYNEQFKNQGIHPDQINSLEDFSRLVPVINKMDVIRNPQYFVASIYQVRSLDLTFTSGTTGTGLTLYVLPKAERYQWAFWWRYRRQFGIDLSEWSAVFGSKPIVPAAQECPPFWRNIYPLRQVYFSIHHLAEQNMQSYVQEIIRRKIRFIHGYRSAIVSLASYIIDKKISFPRQVKWVTLGSENVSLQDGQLIYEAFGVYPLQHYGLAEGNANISMCKNGNLHVDEDFAFVELLPSEEFPGYCRIIGSTLWKTAMPLIRYDTGDLAVFDPSITCPCGNLGRVISSIEGRSTDYVIAKTGKKIIGMNQMFKYCKEIKEVQVMQEKPGCMAINIVPLHDRLLNTDLQSIKGEVFKSMTPQEMEIQINKVDQVERASSGKSQLVIRGF